MRFRETLIACAAVLFVGCSSGGSSGGSGAQSSPGASDGSPEMPEGGGSDAGAGDGCDASGRCAGGNEVVEIEWWHALAGTLAERLEEQVARYHASQDAFRIVPRATGSYAETLAAGLAAQDRGEAPTVLQVYEVGTATMTAMPERTVSVDALMERAGRTFDVQRYFASIASYYSANDGTLLSLPYNSSTPVLFANLDALRDAGLDSASLPRTWPELEGLLRTLKDRGHACPLTTSWPSWIHLENLGALHDVPFASGGNGFDGPGSELLFDRGLFVDHVALLDRWADEGLFVYSGRLNAGGEPFRRGECALLAESSASYAGTRAVAEFELVIVPLPHYDTAGAPYNTIIGGASLWFMAGEDEEEYLAAADFVEFLSSTEEQARWHQATGYLPLTPAALELSRTQGFYEREPGTEVAVEQMLGRTPTENSRGVRLGDFVAIREIIAEELESVWIGTADAASALARAVGRGNERLRAFERPLVP